MVNPEVDVRFCAGCGQKLEPGQNFCPKCGKPTVGTKSEAPAKWKVSEIGPGGNEGKTAGRAGTRGLTEKDRAQAEEFTKAAGCLASPLLFLYALPELGIPLGIVAVYHHEVGFMLGGGIVTGIIAVICSKTAREHWNNGDVEQAKKQLGSCRILFLVALLLFGAAIIDAICRGVAWCNSLD